MTFLKSEFNIQMLKHSCFSKSPKQECPCEGVIKINVDGASKINPGRPGVRGLIKDDKGTWVGGFCKDYGLARESAIASPYHNLLKRIRGMSDRDWSCTLQHTWREGNRCATG